LTLDAVDPAGRFVNSAETEMTIIDPQLATRKLPLVQVAPGRYVADFETPLPGAYHLELTQKAGGQVLYQQSRGISVGYSDELRLKPTNENLLKSIAQSSGGTYGISAADVFSDTGATARRATPLWPWLVTTVMLLLVLDVALRRIDLNLLSGAAGGQPNSQRRQTTARAAPRSRRPEARVSASPASIE
jgi:hypothetical protein